MYCLEIPEILTSTGFNSEYLQSSSILAMLGSNVNIKSILLYSMKPSSLRPFNLSIRLYSLSKSSISNLIFLRDSSYFWMNLPRILLLFTCSKIDWFLYRWKNSITDPRYTFSYEIIISSSMFLWIITISYSVKF
jgi:hypothetical protein